MKRHTYCGANLVPIAIAVPKTFFQFILLLNSKYLFFSTNSAILTKSSVGMPFLPCLSKASLRVLNPAPGGVLGYNPTTIPL